MNPVKRLDLLPVPQGFTPKMIPEIIRQAHQMNERQAVVYCGAEKKPYLFESGRLVIRPFSPGDGALVQALAIDKENSPMRYRDHAWPTDPEGCAGAAKYFAGGDVYWAVCLKPELKLIGLIAFNSVDEQGWMDLGHVWLRAHQDGELDTEALSLMARYAFDRLGVHGICAHNPLDWEPQIAPLRRLGMEVVSTSEASFAKDAQGNPVVFTACKMEITRERWRKGEEELPEGYSPKTKPAILSAVEEAGRAAAQKTAACVLEGVRSISYGDPSAVCFIGSVMALMEYRGDPVAMDELFSLGGVALCFPWKASSCCDEVSIIPELRQRTFRALGYESECVYETDLTGSRRVSREVYKRKIRDSIDSGRPVLGFGLLNHDPFACVITGYDRGGEGLYLRSYWSQDGKPVGYKAEIPYFYTESWYDECYGIIVVGEKTGSRLSGQEALRFLCESAELLRAKSSLSIQGQEMAVGFAAYDAMIAWLLDDSEWQRVENRHEVSLAYCGILLLGHYRSYLYTYLIRHFGECAHGVQIKLLSALAALGESVGGEDSRLHLDRKVDPEITEYGRLTDRRLRKKVTDYIGRLRDYDTEIFDCLRQLEI